MQAKAVLLVALVALLTDKISSRVVGPREREIVLKSFNYQGPLQIKDDRTGEIIREDQDDSIPIVDTSPNRTVDEIACWNLIVEQSDVTFALQNRVINELEADMKDLKMDEALRSNVEKLMKSMRSSMQTALNALKAEAPEEYFESLFETSESIVSFSSLIRDPNLDEPVFLVLVKAVSRLGRNNSGLVQDFVDNCTIIERTHPRPRQLTY